MENPGLEYWMRSCYLSLERSGLGSSCFSNSRTMSFNLIWLSPNTSIKWIELKQNIYCSLKAEWLSAKKRDLLIHVESLMWTALAKSSFQGSILCLSSSLRHSSALQFTNTHLPNFHTFLKIKSLAFFLKEGICCLRFTNSILGVTFSIDQFPSGL